MGGSATVQAHLTRDALQEKIEEQKSLGLLSIFTNTEATDDKLLLIHSMDQIIPFGNAVSITGNSLDVSKIIYTDNDIEPPNSIPDNFVRRDHSYGLPFYPFGLTWTPQNPGLYVIYARAMDTISRNFVMSQPMFISATTGTGMVPMIELDPVSTPLTYDGTQQTIDLSARALIRMAR